MNKKQQKNNKNEKNAFVWFSLGSSFQQWHAWTDSTAAAINLSSRSWLVVSHTFTCWLVTNT
jgi:hypothetical protein